MYSSDDYSIIVILSVIFCDIISDILEEFHEDTSRGLQDPQLWETLVGFVLQHSHLLVPLLDSHNGHNRPLRWSDEPHTTYVSITDKPQYG